MHTMWGHWAPPLERSKLVAFTYAGMYHYILYRNDPIYFSVTSNLDTGLNKMSPHRPNILAYRVY